MIHNFKNTFLLFFFLLSVFSFTASFANNLHTATESRKVKFERYFTEQCVNKEIRNSVNKEEDRRRFTAPCSCIAKRMATDLSIPDIEKFLDEQKSSHALGMSFDEAAYFCLQNKTKAKPAVLFGKK